MSQAPTSVSIALDADQAERGLSGLEGAKPQAGAQKGTLRRMALRHQSIAAIAASLPGACDVLLRHKIDFCSKGEATLALAAEARRLNLAELQAELSATARQAEPYPTEPAALIAHIIERYHKVHRLEFPGLIDTARRVDATHKDRCDCPRGLHDLLSRMFEDLEDHQHKEEAILFPIMLNGGEPSLHQPIARMLQDHVELIDALDLMADLTGDFAPPADACGSWRALYVGCRKLDADLRVHVHLENNLLFPRFS